ncbi:MAG TPA: polysaccharide deacetylase family protein [Mycobacteriales bacterium]|nr:polysaccharide deacetylase family protein [Mycobacteriales bacterium]
MPRSIRGVQRSSRTLRWGMLGTVAVLLVVDLAIMAWSFAGPSTAKSAAPPPSVPSLPASASSTGPAQVSSSKATHAPAPSSSSTARPSRTSTSAPPPTSSTKPPVRPPTTPPPAALPPALGSLHRAPGLPSPLPAGAVALTFDDGPDPTWTPKILAILAAYHARATFFVIGTNAHAHPELVRAEYLAGHGVGSHTWSHPDLTRLPAAQVQQQLQLTQVAVAQATGKAPTCLRPPYDAINAPVRIITAQNKLTMMLYDVDPRDWQRPGANAIAARVLAAIHPGAVVDMHDAGGNRSETVAALPLILQGLQARHLTPVAMCR